MIPNIQNFNPPKRKLAVLWCRTAQLIANSQFLPERSRDGCVKKLCDKVNKLSIVKHFFTWIIFFVFWKLMDWPIFAKKKISRKFNSYCTGTSNSLVKKKTTKNVYLGVPFDGSTTFLSLWIFASFLDMIHNSAPRNRFYN